MGVSWATAKKPDQLPHDDDLLAQLPPAKRSRKLRYMALAMAAWGLWASGFWKVFQGKPQGPDGPPLPPHYEYTLKDGVATTTALAKADCGKHGGELALKHFDSLLQTGVSGTHTDTGNAFVHDVWEKQYLLCATDAPGDMGGKVLPGKRIVVDKTMSDETPASSALYMIMYKQNLDRGTLNYDYKWSLSQRQVHLQSFEAAALTAQMSVAWQKKAVGQTEMWDGMGMNPALFPLLGRFDRNVDRAKEMLGGGGTISKETMELASRLTFPEIFQNRAFADRYNNYLLNVYVQELDSGKLKGPGGSDNLEFGDKMGHVSHNFNSVSGAMAAPMAERFGDNNEMLHAFKAVEQLRKEKLGKPSNSSDRAFQMEKKHNLFGGIDMASAVKEWKSTGAKGNFLDHIRHKAGLDEVAPSQKNLQEKSAPETPAEAPATAPKPPVPVS